MLQIQVPSVDGVVNTPVVQPTALNVLLVTQRQRPKIQKIVEILQLHFLDAVQKTVELVQVQRTERIIEVAVALQHQVPTIQTVQMMVEVRQSHRAPMIQKGGNDGRVASGAVHDSDSDTSETTYTESEKSLMGTLAGDGARRLSPREHAMH